MNDSLGSHRTVRSRAMVAAVAAALAVGAVACASTDEVRSAQLPVDGAITSSSEPDTGIGRPGNRGAGIFFAGLPLGSSDVFDAPQSVAELISESAATVSGSVVEYEILDDPELTSFAYSGPGGVVRLSVEVDSMYGATSAVASVSDGGRKPVVYVDYPNWITGNVDTEFRERLDLAVAARPPVLLILRVGTTDGERATGAYTPVWVPLGVLDVVDGKLAVPTVDRELVERDARARGESRSSAPSGKHEDGGNSEADTSAPSAGLLDSVVGQSLDEFVRSLGIERREPVIGADLQSLLDRG